MKFLTILLISVIFYCKFTYSLTNNRHKRDLKDDLLKKADEVEKNATAQIEKLKASNRTALADGLETEVKSMEEITAKLKNTTATEGLRQLEGKLNLTITIITKQVIDLEREAQTKEDLLTKAAKLQTYIAAEVKALQDSGKTSAASNLQKEGVLLEGIVSSMRLPQTDGKMRLILSELIKVEGRITQELNQLGFKTDATSGTTQTINTTTKPTDPNTSTITTIQAITTTQSVSNITKTASLTTIQTIVTTNRTPIVTNKPTDNLKRDNLLRRAAALKDIVSAEIKKLESSNRSSLASGLKLEEGSIQEVTDELKKATVSEGVSTLESVLSLIEIRVEAEMIKIAKEISSNT